MAEMMQFDLVSPERRLAAFEVSEVSVPGAEGDMTAMAGHMPLLTTLRPGVGAVLHTHSVWGTLLSDLYHGEGALRLHGYEMLKAFGGVPTHDHAVEVPIFENTQDIATLADAVAARMDDTEAPPFHGYLIRRHGLYTWGGDLEEARRHVEAFEFLFEVTGRALGLNSALAAGLPAPPGRTA